MKNVIDREEFRKLIVEKIAETASSVADVLFDLLDTGQAGSLDRVVRKESLIMGEEMAVIFAQAVARSTRAQAHHCPCCGRPMRFKQHRPMQLRCGLTGRPLRVSSPYFICDRCHIGAMALRRELRLDEDGLSSTASLVRLRTYARKYGSQFVVWCE